MKQRRLPAAVVSAIDASKILGVRAGVRSDHRFVGIWAVVVAGRVFARSWSRRPSGWYRTFLEDPLGTLQVGERQVRIRAVPIRGERIRDAVERAYAAKYPTPGLTFLRARLPQPEAARHDDGVRPSLAPAGRRRVRPSPPGASPPRPGRCRHRSPGRWGP